MDNVFERREVARLTQLFQELGWEVVRDYRIESGGQVLHADAVLLFKGLILAVVEVKSARVLSDRFPSSSQLKVLAASLGAPLAILVWNGEFFQLRDAPGSFRPLRSLPTPDETLGILGLSRSQVPATCQAVARALLDWEVGGATRTGTYYLPAIQFYAAEHNIICPQAPLTQCVLIGGMLEGLLRETAVAKDPAKAGHHRHSKLAPLIGWCIKKRFISAGTGKLTPHAIRKNRNALHPDAFITSPVIGRGIAKNSALALAAVVRELNASV